MLSPQNIALITVDINAVQALKTTYVLMKIANGNKAKNSNVKKKKKKKKETRKCCPNNTWS